MAFNLDLRTSHTTRILTHEDLPRLMDFYDTCTEYTALLSGEITPSDVLAHELLEECPEGRGPEHKSVGGIFEEGGDLVGVLDLIQGYPTEETWFLGLLLLHPRIRGGGLGAQVLDAVKREIPRHGGQKLRLAVLHNNPRALHFWKNQGLRVIDNRPMKYPPYAQVYVLEMGL